MTNVAETGILYVLLNIIPVCWMGAFLDNYLGTLHGSQASEIRQTLFSDDYLNRVCSLLSTCEHIGTIEDILPPLAMEGVMKMER